MTMVLTGLLLAFLGWLLGQRLHFFRINLYFAGFFHCGAQVFQEQAKHFGLVVLQNRIVDLILLGCKVLVGWILAVGHGKNRTGAAIVNWTAHVARF